MTDLNPYGDTVYAKCINELPGNGRLVQVWVLQVSGDSATLRCYVTDVNRAVNMKLPGDNDFTLQDGEVKNWEDGPKEVRNMLSEKLNLENVELI